jgi:competence/damage-inducible protein CinA-like protein
LRVRVEILGVGTELLLGQIANTNARWMSEELAGVGVDVEHHQVVGDNLDRIVAAMALSASRADVVVVTGGLGPTPDDITRDALASLLDTAMVRDPSIEEFLRHRFVELGRPMPEANLRQADVPIGAHVIMPRLGSAPGLVADAAGARLYLLPGVPAEMREMMTSTVLPELAGRAGARIVSRVLRCAEIGESRVAEILDDLFHASANPSVAYLASDGEVKVRLTAKAATDAEATLLIGPLLEAVRARLGDAVFTTADESLEQVVGRRLEEAGRHIAIAESLTGGGVATRLTRVPGASRYFRGAAVVYSAEAKRDVLGVSQATLDGPGAVSEACAREMAGNVRRLFDADVGLSLTGAAGPDAHAGAPAGTVWIGLDAGDERRARGLRVSGGRERVRRLAGLAALDLVRRHLEGRSLPGSDVHA